MPLSRAASVVQAMGLDEFDAARRNRERIAPAAAPKASGKRKVSLAVPKALQLHKGSEDATDQRFAHARVNGEIIGRLGDARHFTSPFSTLAKKQYLNPGESKAAQYLNDALYAAGQKYAEIYEGAHIGPLRSAEIATYIPRSTSPRVMHQGEYGMSCRKRVDDARDVVGPRLIGLLDAVVIEGRTLTEIAPKYGYSKDLRIAQTEVRVMLVEALHMLVRHWRMYMKPQGEAA